MILSIGALSHLQTGLETVLRCQLLKPKMSISLFAVVRREREYETVCVALSLSLSLSPPSVRLSVCLSFKFFFIIIVS